MHITRIASISSAALAAILLAGCSTGGGTDSPTGAVKADLGEQFTQADSPRVPTRDDLIGAWKVTQPATPPQGQGSRFASIEFGNTEHQAEVNKEKFQSAREPAVAIALDLGVCPLKGVQAALISDDGGLQVQFKSDDLQTMELCLGDDGTSLDIMRADGTDDYIAIDKQGNLWVKDDSGVFKFQKVPGNSTTS